MAGSTSFGFRQCEYEEIRLRTIETFDQADRHAGLTQVSTKRYV